MQRYDMLHRTSQAQRQYVPSGFNLVLACSTGKDWWQRHQGWPQKVSKKSMQSWADIWNWEHQRWLQMPQYKINKRDLNWLLLQKRMNLWSHDQTCLMQVQGKFQLWALAWKDKGLLPIPNLPYNGPTLHTKLNARWHLLQDRRQWNESFTQIWWGKSCLMWPILHKALWTNESALKLGFGSGISPRWCKKDIETIPHLFISYKNNRECLAFIQKCILPRHQQCLSWKEILLGHPIKVSIRMWNVISVDYLWNVWLCRNLKLFQNVNADVMSGLRNDLYVQMKTLVKANWTFCNTQFTVLQGERCKSR